MKLKNEADIHFTFQESDRLLILLDALTKAGGLEYAQDCVYFKNKIQNEFKIEEDATKVRSQSNHKRSGN